VEPLPIVAPSCSLSDLELRAQLARYRVIGDGAEVLEWSARRRAIRLARSVPEPVVERVVEVERQCCPFFGLSWDRASRRLTISVTARDQEPALDALAHALGLAQPASVLAERPGLTARH
jgi:hypothetical protein